MVGNRSLARGEREASGGRIYGPGRGCGWNSRERKREVGVEATAVEMAGGVLSVAAGVGRGRPSLAGCLKAVLLGVEGAGHGARVALGTGHG